MNKIIGLVGFIGSGKGTVGDYLNHHGYKTVSFATALKDCLSAIFGWDRELLEGSTVESRQWRETPDIYWSKKMQRTVTPRWAMQYMGTDVMRNHFFNDIWVASLEKRITDMSTNIAVTDARFPNELKMIRDNGGEIYWVQRGELPEWYDIVIKNEQAMKTAYPDIHPSEYLWINQGPFKILNNNSSLDQLHTEVDKIL
jgi:hypothetical protein